MGVGRPRTIITPDSDAVREEEAHAVLSSGARSDRRGRLEATLITILRQSDRSAAKHLGGKERERMESGAIERFWSDQPPGRFPTVLGPSPGRVIAYRVRLRRRSDLLFRAIRGGGILDQKPAP